MITYLKFFLAKFNNVNLYVKIIIKYNFLIIIFLITGCINKSISQFNQQERSSALKLAGLIDHQMPSVSMAELIALRKSNASAFDEKVKALSFSDKKLLIFKFLVDFQVELKPNDSGFNLSFADFLKTIQAFLPGFRVYDYFRYLDLDPQLSLKGINFILKKNILNGVIYSRIHERVPAHAIFLEDLHAELEEWRKNPQEQSWVISHYIYHFSALFVDGSPSDPHFVVSDSSGWPGRYYGAKEVVTELQRSGFKNISIFTPNRQSAPNICFVFALSDIYENEKNSIFSWLNHQRGSNLEIPGIRFESELELIDFYPESWMKLSQSLAVISNHQPFWSQCQQPLTHLKAADLPFDLLQVTSGLGGSQQPLKQYCSEQGSSGGVPSWLLESLEPMEIRGQIKQVNFSGVRISFKYFELLLRTLLEPLTEDALLSLPSAG